ncbi:CTB family bacteriocin [Cylindrospermum sp. FACHB-282]|uniref:CTB family bacteriocin n=1 Tax=Cylindrospermum sp. FACHB-282 TaxID=2692794 RepID=UPI001682A67C|nr:CTB family bacteriocin [Cylindrospermum sp. FACHB-282]MBD2385677.1 hypothetical protein [Cylindrospermum sp. FACHB-282]
MSNQIIASQLFITLSDEQQQFINGGQDLVLGSGPLPIQGGTLTGTTDMGKATNTQGQIFSGPAGSISDALGGRKGTKTAANTSVITPPAFLSIGTLK